MEKNEVRPGEELALRVFLRPYRGERVVKDMKLRIPELQEGARKLALELEHEAPEDAEFWRDFAEQFNKRAIAERQHTAANLLYNAKRTDALAEMDEIIRHLKEMYPLYEGGDGQGGPG